MKKKMTIPEVNELGNVLTPEEMKEIMERESCKPGSCICHFNDKLGQTTIKTLPNTFKNSKECRLACEEECKQNRFCFNGRYGFITTCTPGSCSCGSEPGSCDCGSDWGSCDK